MANGEYSTGWSVLSPEPFHIDSMMQSKRVKELHFVTDVQSPCIRNVGYPNAVFGKRSNRAFSPSIFHGKTKLEDE